jgi:hypothetical protein
MRIAATIWLTAECARPADRATPAIVIDRRRASARSQALGGSVRPVLDHGTFLTT